MEKNAVNIESMLLELTEGLEIDEIDQSEMNFEDDEFENAEIEEEFEEGWNDV